MLDHADYQVLYAQRLWGFLLPKLVAGHKASSDEGSKQLYLSAFAASLPVAPPSVFTSSAAQIFPLLILSLSLPDASERTNILNALIVLFGNSKTSTDVNKLLHEHALTIVDAVLSCSVQGPQSSSVSDYTSLYLMTGITQDCSHCHDSSS